MLYTMYSVSWAIGWSDIELFCDFPKRALHVQYAADQGYFYESNSENRRIWPRVPTTYARQSFHFKKPQGP